MVSLQGVCFLSLVVVEREPAGALFLSETQSQTFAFCCPPQCLTYNPRTVCCVFFFGGLLSQIPCMQWGRESQTLLPLDSLRQNTAIVKSAFTADQNPRVSVDIHSPAAKWCLLNVSYCTGSSCCWAVWPLAVNSIIAVSEFTPLTVVLYMQFN